MRFGRTALTILTITGLILVLGVLGFLVYLTLDTSATPSALLVPAKVEGNSQSAKAEPTSNNKNYQPAEKVVANEPEQIWGASALKSAIIKGQIASKAISNTPINNSSSVGVLTPQTASNNGSYLATTPAPNLPGAPAFPLNSYVALSGDWKYGDITQGEPTAAAIDRWLANYHSPHLAEAPAGETIGQIYLRLGRKYGINPAYAVAFFTKESSCGTQGANLSAHNFGNLRWREGFPSLDNVWRAYPDWTSGMEGWFYLIKEYYINDLGKRTVDEILPIYAPDSENDTQLYITQVKQWVNQLMQG